MSTPFRTLSPGACIGVIAPAGPSDPERVARVAPLLEALGWRAKVFPGCLQRCGYLAGPDEVRLADLHAVFDDPEVDAIVCLRGGYGAMRLLDRIDAARLAQRRKLLIGYSDITALHALLDRVEVPSLHGPMLTSDLIRDGYAPEADALAALLRQGLVAGTCWAPALDADAPRIGGRARGRLVGGNLSLVAHLVGTPWAWRTAGAIVFLEDVGEDAYRIDRYLCQLRLAGALDAAAGFLLGSFTGGEPARPVLEQYLAPLGKPVLGGWPAGHGRPNRPLPMGVRVEIDGDAGTLTVLDDFLLPARP